MKPSSVLGVWCASVAVIVAASIGIVYYFAYPDSGVAACEAMRDNARKHQAGEDASLTETEYHEIRDIFASSEHEDLRDAGTRFIDVSWQLASVDRSRLDDEVVLMYSRDLVDSYMDLVGACAAQDVSIPTLGQLSKP